MKYILSIALIAGLISHPEKVFCKSAVQVCVSSHCTTTYQCPFTQYIVVEN